MKRLLVCLLLVGVVGCGESDAEKAINLDKLIPDHNRFNSSIDLGQDAKAIADFTEAIRINPDYAVAYNNRGVAYFVLGQDAKAIADYNEAIRIDPDFAAAYANRGGTRRA